jgi:hypothetical protein
MLLYDKNNEADFRKKSKMIKLTIIYLELHF